MSAASARYPGRAAIDAYGNGGFRFAGMSHRGSILCLPSGVYAWAPAGQEKIDPAGLEARLTATAPANTLLPVNHRAKLWEMYEELYGQISREAETDFHRLFGEQFLRAYQAKVGVRHDGHEGDGAT